MALTASDLQIAFQNLDTVRHFFFYPTIGSTNEKAKELALVGAEEGTLVVADGQTSGRGRSGRHWFSPPGLGIYASMIFRPDVPADRAFGVHMAVSLGAAEAASRQHPQSSVGMKWPNDVVVEGRKLAGILAEVGFRGRRLDWCVVGVGLNVNHTTTDFPLELRDKAISLRELCHRRLDRTQVLVHLLDGIRNWYERFVNDDLDSLIAEWRRRSTIIGRAVRVETPGETYVGQAIGLEDDGSLRIRLENGAEEILHAGDVHLVQYR